MCMYMYAFLIIDMLHVKVHVLLCFTVGHGNSEGDRVHVETFDTYVQDVAGHMEEMTSKHPGVPSMMLGHSMVSCNASCYFTYTFAHKQD